MTPDGVRREAPAEAAPTAAPTAAQADVPLALRHELARKALHISSAAVPLAYASGLVPRRWLAAFLLAMLGVALAVELGRARSERLRAHFTRATGALLRSHEHHRLSGATWLLAAFTLAVLLFPPAIAVAATWAVSIGDAGAAVVGRTFGRRRIGGLSKTVEGSVACAALTFVGARFVARIDVGACIVAAICAALAEAPRRPLDDNVRVALAVGGGILLWRMTFS